MVRIARPVALIVALTATGCGGDVHQPGSVLIEDERTLLVPAGCPEDDPEAQLVETPAEIRISVSYKATRKDCMRFVRVQLREPLGRRLLKNGKGDLLAVHDRRCTQVAGARCDGVEVKS